MGGEVVGDQHLLDQAAEDEEEGPRGVHVARVARAAQLRQELRGAGDGAGGEVREEGDVHGEVEQRRRPQGAAVHVDDVAQHAEREERDAERQDDAQQRQVGVQVQRVEEVDGRGDEEAVILEPAEHAEVGGDGRSQRPPAPGAALRHPPDPEREELVGDGAERKQKDEAPVPPPVEHQADDQHERLPHALPGHEQPVPDEDEQEEDGECDGREQHATGLAPQSRERDGRSPATVRGRAFPAPARGASRIMTA